MLEVVNYFDVKGWRIEMEDAHSAVIGIPDQKENVSWFAGRQLCVFLIHFKFTKFPVFDGHAGGRVSAHCSHHLLDCIRLVDNPPISQHTSTKETQKV